MRETYVRNELVDGIGPWTWLVKEDGVWDGPSKDWLIHKTVWIPRIKNFRKCIQAGGALGMYPRLLARYFQEVHTFEPDPTSYSVLVQNVSKDANIIHRNMALGCKEDTLILNVGDQNNVGTHRIVSETDAYTIQVPGRTLDSFGFDDVDFIQLDVEGYELNLLKGAVETIQKSRPAISCENGNENLRYFLAQFGYVMAATSVADTLYLASENL